MLSEIGRGFNEIVVYKERIFSQMRQVLLFTLYAWFADVMSPYVYCRVMQLLDAASCPVVCGLQVDVPGVESFDLYPSPLPDLFLGAPLVRA